MNLKFPNFVFLVDSSFVTSSYCMFYFSQRHHDSFLLYFKGCTKTAQNALMYCNLANYNGWKVHEENGESAQYAFDCCSENLCNNGTEWPELPDVPVLGQCYYFCHRLFSTITVAIQILESGKPDSAKYSTAGASGF